MTKIENHGNEKDASKLIFPGIILREEIGSSTYTHESLGLSKREYFAGLAMQSAIKRMDMSGNDFGAYIKNVAINAVKFADALVAELSKEGE